MTMKDMVLKCRSYRRFYQEDRISRETMLELVDLGRQTSSAANAQALKFKICCEEEENARIFDTIGWAGALPDWAGPEEGERPSGYIVILCDLALGKNKMTDDGIVAQTMMLAAVEQGYGGCMIATFKRTQVAEILGIDTEKYSLDLILALGRPKEEVRMVPVKEDGSVTYYRDEAGVHYVPKRSLEEVLL